MAGQYVDILYAHEGGIGGAAELSLGINIAPHVHVRLPQPRVYRPIEDGGVPGKVRHTTHDSTGRPTVGRVLHRVDHIIEE